MREFIELLWVSENNTLQNFKPSIIYHKVLFDMNSYNKLGRLSTKHSGYFKTCDSFMRQSVKSQTFRSELSKETSGPRHIGEAYDLEDC